MKLEVIIMTARSKKRWVHTALFICVLIAVVTVIPAYAESLTLSDATLDGIDAKGNITVGSFSFTDNHQFDASQFKGAIHMDGFVQQNVTAEVNLNETQSAAAIGVNIIGDIASSTGQTITQTNTNTATNFIGGF